MAQQTIDIGLAVNDGTGDPARTAFGKCNDNFADHETRIVAIEGDHAGPSSTWAARGAGSVVGEIKRITDIGPTGGSRMMWNGTYWRLVARTFLSFDTTLASGTASTSEQIIKQVTLPAGILRAGSVLTLLALFAKDGVTDAMTAARMRIGTAGTTSDAQIYSSNVLGTSSRQLAIPTPLFVSSATQLRVLSQASTLTFSGAATSTAYPTNIAVSDVDANAFILSATTQMAGTTNLGQVAHLLVELNP